MTWDGGWSWRELDVVLVHVSRDGSSVVMPSRFDIDIEKMQGQRGPGCKSLIPDDMSVGHFV